MKTPNKKWKITFNLCKKLESIIYHSLISSKIMQIQTSIVMIEMIEMMIMHYQIGRRNLPNAKWCRWMVLNRRDTCTMASNTAKGCTSKQMDMCMRVSGRWVTRTARANYSTKTAHNTSANSKTGSDAAQVLWSGKTQDTARKASGTKTKSMAKVKKGSRMGMYTRVLSNMAGRMAKGSTSGPPKRTRKGTTGTTRWTARVYCSGHPPSYGRKGRCTPTCGTASALSAGAMARASKAVSWRTSGKGSASSSSRMTGSLKASGSMTSNTAVHTLGTQMG